MKKMTCKTLLFSVPAMVLVTGDVRAVDWDEVKILAQAATEKLMLDLEFVKTCFVVPDIGDFEVCLGANLPGTPEGSLVCPPPSAITTVNKHCDITIDEEMTASLGKKGKQLLRMASKHTVVFRMIGEEKSIADHLHIPDGSAQSCAEEYIQAQYSAEVLFAGFQTGSVTAEVPDELGEIAAYKVALSEEKSIYFSQGLDHYCIRRNHGEPRSCALCGNGEPDPGEECDPPDYVHCDGECQWICGDNVKQQGEECDGTSDAACPGRCRGDCTCAVTSGPAMPKWALVATLALLLAAGTVIFGKMRRGKGTAG